MKKSSVHSASAFTLLLPTAFVGASLRKDSIFLLIVGLVLLFFLLAVVPAFHRHESLWMFLAVIPLSAPVNMALLRHPYLAFLLEDSHVIVRVLWAALLYCILFSVEEIIFGIAARILWPRQIRSFPETEE